MFPGEFEQAATVSISHSASSVKVGFIEIGSSVMKKALDNGITDQHVVVRKSTTFEIRRPWASVLSLQEYSSNLREQSILLLGE